MHCIKNLRSISVFLLFLHDNLHILLYDKKSGMKRKVTTGLAGIVLTLASAVPQAHAEKDIIDLDDLDDLDPQRPCTKAYRIGQSYDQEDLFPCYLQAGSYVQDPSAYYDHLAVIPQPISVRRKETVECHKK